MLSRQQLRSKGDLSINFGLVESNNYEGSVADEERSRVMEHKQFLMDQQARQRVRQQREKERGLAEDQEALKQGLLQFEQDRQAREERRKAAHELNKEVWSKQIELKRRHKQISGSVGRAKLL